MRNLPPDTQLQLLRRMQSETLTAKQVEQLAKHTRSGCQVLRRPVPTPHKFKTGVAVVSIQFRTDEVTAQDLLDALEEAKQQIRPANLRAVPS